jgi:clan AA aspartic protease
MISGQVNSNLEAVILLTVLGPYGEAREIEAIIDTGFSGYLTLPPEIITTLGIDAIAVEQAILADGAGIPSELCMAKIVWDGRERAIEINTLESDPLVGMALLDGYEVNIRVAVGGGVTIESFSTT